LLGKWSITDSYYRPMPVADLGDLKVHFRQHGEDRRSPVLGIMGFGVDQRFWAAQIAAVTQTHRFITFDNRGIGRSSAGTVTSIDEMADDATRLLDHLGIEKTVVFGVSMGGAIAQRLVLDHPERVSALILAATWARPIEFMRRQTDLARRVIELQGAEGLVDSSLIFMFTPRFFEVGQEAIDSMVAAFFADSGPGLARREVLYGQLDAILKHDTLSELARVSVPTLVVGSRMDMIVPGFASEEIARAIPGAELVMMESGHGAMVEEMEPFNAALTRFLAKL
jgi:pimeloyl-ACP methyl ester carboxylesterase